MKHFIKNFFKDENGKVVIAQSPNKPLILAIIFYVFQHINIPFLAYLGKIGFIISITYWSYLEVFYGVNSWRRFLGIIVLLFTLFSLIF